MTEGREFARLRREGRSHPGRYLVLSTMNDASAIAASPFRVGLITTKKLGNAVARNRIRRRLRAIVDEFANRFVPGTQLVIIARYRAPVASYQALREDWKRLAKRAGVLRRTPEVGLCVEPGDAHPPSIS